MMDDIINKSRKDVIAFAVRNEDGTVNVHVVRPEKVSILNVPVNVPVKDSLQATPEVRDSGND